MSPWEKCCSSSFTIIIIDDHLHPSFIIFSHRCSSSFTIITIAYHHLRPSSSHLQPESPSSPPYTFSDNHRRL
ncbi:hypothetical protein HanPSC8_Chr04g0168841 [Helianthus annuus]|nr:hypothetical protein HanPSC8_Chr04g0168841 [Helianthus annuus]